MNIIKHYGTKEMTVYLHLINYIFERINENKLAKLCL